jgi:succinate dehydrogenase / fumarate reductase cytochrome b subunit
MTVHSRPLSPHLDIYRWQIGNTLSILHRATGILLALGFAALCGWLIALASGPDSYRTVAHLFGSPVGLIALIGWTFAFLYHLLNGVRHLLWDVGLGFERRQRHGTGWLAVIGAVTVTAGVWALLWHFGRL